jgi:hypothetical protein
MHRRHPRSSAKPNTLVPAGVDLVSPAEQMRQLFAHASMLSPETIRILIRRAQPLFASAAVNVTALNMVAAATANAVQGTSGTPPQRRSHAAQKLPWPRPVTSTVVILVEMNCQQGMRTMRHDKLKYDRYFEELREAIGTEIFSPDGRYRLLLAVEATQAVVPAHDPFTVNTDTRMGRHDPFTVNTDTRMGAFEVYMISQLPEVPAIPPCITLFSKLSTKRWPNVKTMAQKCQALLAPAFTQWDADEELSLKLSSVRNAGAAQDLVTEYRGRVSTALLDQLEYRRDAFEGADAAILEARLSDIPTLRQALLEQRERASPNVVEQAAAQLAQMEADQALESARDIGDLFVAIEKYQSVATKSTVSAVTAKLQLWRSDAALRAEVARLVETDALKAAIAKFGGKASAKSLAEAERKLAAYEVSNAAVKESMQKGSIDHLLQTIDGYSDRASPTILSDAKEMLVQLEAEEALEMAQSEADAALSAAFSASPAEPDALATAIALHYTLASANVLEEAGRRLRVSRADSALRSELAPLTEAADVRQTIDVFRSRASEALEEAEVRLEKLTSADRILSEAMLVDIPSLQQALAQMRSELIPSPSVLSASEAKLVEMKADEELRLARMLPEAPQIRVALETHCALASAAAVTSTQERLRALSEKDDVLSEAMQQDIPTLMTAIEESRGVATPSVVSSAESVLAQLEANAALRATPAEIEALNAAIEEHGNVASSEVVAETAALRTLLETLLRELQADDALERLIASKHFDEAAKVREALIEHGEYAAYPLVGTAQEKLQALEGADAALQGAMDSLLRSSLPEPIEQPWTPADERECAPRLTDALAREKALFQAIVDYGPFASRSVRMAAWRSGGSNLSLHEVPEPPPKRNALPPRLVPKPKPKPTPLAATPVAEGDHEPSSMLRDEPGAADAPVLEGQSPTHEPAVASAPEADPEITAAAAPASTTKTPQAVSGAATSATAPALTTTATPVTTAETAATPAATSGFAPHEGRTSTALLQACWSQMLTTEPSCDASAPPVNYTRTASADVACRGMASADTTWCGTTSADAAYCGTSAVRTAPTKAPDPDLTRSASTSTSTIDAKALWVRARAHTVPGMRLMALPGLRSIKSSGFEVIVDPGFAAVDG